MAAQREAVSTGAARAPPSVGCGQSVIRGPRWGWRLRCYLHVAAVDLGLILQLLLGKRLRVGALRCVVRSSTRRAAGAGIGPVTARKLGATGPRSVDAWPVKHAEWRAPPSRHVLRAVMRTRHRNHLLPLVSSVASIIHSHLVARSRAVQARRAGGGRPGGRATRAADALGLPGLVRVRLPGLGGQLSLTYARPATGAAGAMAAAEHARWRVVVPAGGASSSLLRRMRHDA
jgi:hypothetical protein